MQNAHSRAWWAGEMLPCLGASSMLSDFEYMDMRSIASFFKDTLAKFVTSIRLLRVAGEACYLLRQLPRLNRIDVSSLTPNEGLTDESLHRIFACLPDLSFVHVRNCKHITDSVAISLSDHCRHLHELDFGNCTQISDVGIVDLSGHCRKLKSLSVSDTKVTGFSVAVLARRCPELCHLRLVGCTSLEDALLSVAENCTHLTHLNVCRAEGVTTQSLVRVASGCPLLQHLNANLCFAVGDEAVESLAAQCLHIKEIYLSHTDISDASIAKIAECCKNLVELDVEDCYNLTVEAANHLRLIVANCCNFRRLALSAPLVEDDRSVIQAWEIRGVQVRIHEGSTLSEGSDSLPDLRSDGDDNDLDIELTD